jgi:hypothetical protein
VGCLENAACILPILKRKTSSKTVPIILIVLGFYGAMALTPCITMGTMKLIQAMTAPTKCTRKFRETMRKKNKQAKMMLITVI